MSMPNKRKSGRSSCRQAPGRTDSTRQPHISVSSAHAGEESSVQQNSGAAFKFLQGCVASESRQHVGIIWAD